MKRGRFIAGAVCPACGAVDRIVVEGSADDLTSICVACAYRKTLPVAPCASPAATKIVRLIVDIP